MNETTKPAPSILDLLVLALVEQVKAKLMECIDERIANNAPTIHAEAVEGLEEWFDSAIEEHDRHGGRFKRIAADDITDLDEAIADVIKNGTFNIDFSH